MVEQKIKDVLIHILREIGAYQLENFGKVTDLIQKGRHDYATDVDIKCQEIGIRRFKEYNLPYVIMAEEKTEDVKFPLRLGNDDILYFDPLEGTHNFYRGRKESGFGSTIGIVEENQLRWVIFYNSLTKELYESEKGKGSYLYLNDNKIPLHVSERTTTLDIGFNHWPDIKYAGKYLDKLRGVTDYTPTSVSDAIDLIWVARGSLDGLVFIYKQADPWDMVPALVIEEAGGKVTNIKGDHWYIIDRHGFMIVRSSMIAGNPYVHQMLLNLYKQ
ncbi:MAG: inositol monophosphatase family protein [Candidatus Aenigmarchaeota archaeon]|nr:inositol monophosphatase family protein [Candidatus Aenigmarchaeota archaeon]